MIICLGKIQEKPYGVGIHPRSLFFHPCKPKGEVFEGIREQAVPFLWDQGPKLVTLLQLKIGNWCTKRGSMMKKYTLLQP